MHPRLKSILWPAYDWLDRHIRLGAVLKSGDTAVQIGANLDNPALYSELFQVAKMIGPNGNLIVIEPDSENIRKIKLVKSNYPCNFHIVHGATMDRPGRLILRKGTKASFNALELVRSDFPEASFSGLSEDVEANTLDNFLNHLGIDPSTISHINLTNNGAEHRTLLGMRNVLQAAPNLSLHIVAGRQGESIGYIDGNPDYVVIQNFLIQFGFRTRFRRVSSSIWEGLIKHYLIRCLIRGQAQYFRVLLPGIVFAKKGSKKFRFFEAYS